MITAQIEIIAPPELVRKVLLDFSSYSEWHSSFMQSIKPTTPAKEVIEPGDKLDCDIGGMKFTAVVKENSLSLLQWEGSPLYGLIVGLHSFQVEPSPLKEGTTIFSQTEEFSGLLAFSLAPSLAGKRVKMQFEDFNRDLKVRVEGLGK